MDAVNKAAALSTMGILCKGSNGSKPPLPHYILRHSAKEAFFHLDGDIPPSKPQFSI